MSSLSYSASRKSQLQRELGDIGEVLPRVARGGGRYSAQGWYAEIAGELVFLGDHFNVALTTIARMLEPDE